MPWKWEVFPDEMQMRKKGGGHVTKTEFWEIIEVIFSEWK